MAKKIIIDANRITECATEDPDCDHAPVAKRLFENRTTTIQAVVGGKLLREYLKCNAAWRRIKTLEQAGRLLRFSSAEVDEIATDIEKQGDLKSDDPHVLALAQKSGSRTLFSHDTDLIDDFTNPKLLKPRGSVYKRAEHEHLLR